MAAALTALGLTLWPLWPLPAAGPVFAAEVTSLVGKTSLNAGAPFDGASPFPPADVLLISNSPETVREPGILFQRMLEPHTRYRLFLHHLNQTSADRLSLRVRAVEPEEPAGSQGQGPAVDGGSSSSSSSGSSSSSSSSNSSGGGRLRLTVAGLGISPYPFTSGWQALERYSAAQADTQTFPLAPWPQEVWSLRLPPGQVASGYLLLEVDRAAQLTLQLGEEETPLSPDGVHPRAVIAAPQAREEVYFNLKDRILELRFGSSGAFRDMDTGAPLRGEYGIDYRWDLTVHNPHEVPMPLHLLFIPRGSDGRLLIHVDGKAYQTGRTFSGHYNLVNRWVIYPGQTRTFSLWTTPVPAMGYPAILRFSTYLDPGWPRHPNP